MTGSLRLLAGLVCALAFAACGGEQANTADETDAEALRRDAEFAADTRAARAAREAALVDDEGWTTLVGLHRIELRSHFVGSGEGNGIRLTQGPARLGLLQSDGGRFAFTPEQAVALTLDGAPVSGRVALRSDRDGAADVLGFDEGRGALSIIERGGAAFARVRHADADTRRRFAGLDYWPADRRWRVDAVFVPAAAGAQIDIANILGMIDAMPTPGRVVFERDGATYALDALEGADGGLFLILADRTSGRGSYSAGRYLDVDAPDADGHVTLDFNRAYNPPCAFTPFATCPLPPPGNRLDLVVDAGEKAYRMPR